MLGHRFSSGDKLKQEMQYAMQVLAHGNGIISDWMLGQSGELAAIS